MLTAVLYSHYHHNQSGLVVEIGWIDNLCQEREAMKAKGYPLFLLVQSITLGKLGHHPIVALALV
jgi:hypothetical protein